MIIASDLDGTLFGPDHELSQRTIDVLRTARGVGVRVIAATGRAPTTAVPRLAPHGVVDALICSNGALLHDLDTDTNIRRFPIATHHADALFAALDARVDGLSYCWELEDAYGWDAAFDHIALRHGDLKRFSITPRPPAGSTITKVLVAHPELSSEALTTHLEPHLPGPLSVASSGLDFVEITGAGVDKSTTLNHLVTSWGSSAADVIAFGDSENDAAMLRWAGTGIAVSNAAPTATAAADAFIGHHGDDSVAQYIEELLTSGR